MHPRRGAVTVARLRELVAATSDAEPYAGPLVGLLDSLPAATTLGVTTSEVAVVRESLHRRAARRPGDAALAELSRAFEALEAERVAGVALPAGDGTAQLWCDEAMTRLVGYWAPQDLRRS